MPKNNTAASLAWQVEETCLNAWPALREIVLDGWLVRFSEGLSRRNNSANPLSPRSAIDDATIAGTVAFYRRHDRPAIFRVPSIAAAAVDEALAKEGFAAEAETCVLHGEIGALDTTADAAVRLLPRADRQWFQAMSALQGHKPEQAHTYRRIIGAISVPAAFAAIPGEDGRLVALAYGVIHNGLLCYESVVTDARQRRRGHARRIVTTLGDWARAQGATGACLQVVAENAPARALYDQIGLKTELYRYHYRRAAD